MLDINKSVPSFSKLHPYIKIQPIHKHYTCAPGMGPWSNLMSVSSGHLKSFWTKWDLCLSNLPVCCIVEMKPRSVTGHTDPPKLRPYSFPKGRWCSSFHLFLLNAWLLELIPTMARKVPGWAVTNPFPRGPGGLLSSGGSGWLWISVQEWKIQCDSH